MRRLMMLAIVGSMLGACAEVHGPLASDAGHLEPMGDAGPLGDAHVAPDGGPIDPCLDGPGEILTHEEACAVLAETLTTIELQVRDRDSGARCAEELYVCPFGLGDYIERDGLEQCHVGLRRASYCDDLAISVEIQCPSFVLACE